MKEIFFNHLSLKNGKYSAFVDKDIDFFFFLSTGLLGVTFL